MAEANLSQYVCGRLGAGRRRPSSPPLAAAILLTATLAALSPVLSSGDGGAGRGGGACPDTPLPRGGGGAGDGSVGRDCPARPVDLPGGGESVDRLGWRWVPEAEHRCNITRMSRSELARRFGPAGLPRLYPRPVVIHDGAGGPAGRNAEFVDMTKPENIASAFPPGFEVTLSSSNSFSAHRRTIPLTQYLEETVAAGETLPDALSNETWYLFGETYGPGWKELLLNYELPPCEACTDRAMSALAFGIGNRGSGVQWHLHGPGFSEAIHGRKHWVLYPPDRRPSYDPDYASRHWMEETYARMRDEDELAWECTLRPGEMVYFPDQWHHATINLDPYTAFVSTFTTEHI